MQINLIWQIMLKHRIVLQLQLEKQNLNKFSGYS